MAIPAFVTASTGTTDATGAWTHTSTAPGEAGRILLVHLLQDGTNAAPTITSVTNAEDLAGADNVLTYVGAFPVGDPAAAYQHLWIGRSLSTSAMVITGANAGGDDVYVRVYEFSGVSTGTTLTTVMENPQVFQNTSNITFPIGRDAASTRQAQSFVASGDVTSVDVYLDKVGSPTDSLTVAIQSNAGTVPDDVDLASASVLSSVISTTPAYYSFNVPVSLTAGTTYWVVVRRVGALDLSNYVRWAANSADQLPNPAGTAQHNGTNWVGGSGDFRFKVWGSPPLFHYPNDSTTSVPGPRVTTLDIDRLALQLVAANDDVTIDATTGMTGGTWAEAVAEYSSASGTDGMIQLQTANMASAGEIIGGTATMSLAVAFSTIGFALQPTGAPPAYIPRHPAHDFGSVTNF